MKEPSPMPEPVIAAVWKLTISGYAVCPECHQSIPYWTTFDASIAHERLRGLRWSGDHYGLSVLGMYVGIELDGYTHT